MQPPILCRNTGAFSVGIVLEMCSLGIVSRWECIPVLAGKVLYVNGVHLLPDTLGPRLGASRNGIALGDPVLEVCFWKGVSGWKCVCLRGGQLCVCEVRGFVDLVICDLLGHGPG